MVHGCGISLVHGYGVSMVHGCDVSMVHGCGVSMVHGCGRRMLNSFILYIYSCYNCTDTHVHSPVLIKAVLNCVKTWIYT